jgi:hypothetical protein
MPGERRRLKSLASGDCDRTSTTTQARVPRFREAVRKELDGLPGGRGLNIAHEAVDRHAAQLLDARGLRCRDPRVRLRTAANAEADHRVRVRSRHVMRGRATSARRVCVDAVRRATPNRRRWLVREKGLCSFQYRSRCDTCRFQI